MCYLHIPNYLWVWNGKIHEFFKSLLKQFSALWLSQNEVQINQKSLSAYMARPTPLLSLCFPHSSHYLLLIGKHPSSPIVFLLLSLPWDKACIILFSCPWPALFHRHSFPPTCPPTLSATSYLSVKMELRSEILLRLEILLRPIALWFPHPPISLHQSASAM